MFKASRHDCRAFRAARFDSQIVVGREELTNHEGARWIPCGCMWKDVQNWGDREDKGSMV
jgi:hypothetical protein